MRKLFALLVCALLVLSVAACAKKEDNGGTTTETTDSLQRIRDAGKLIVGTSPDYAPYEFKDPTKSGQDAIVGADILMMKYIAEQLGVELDIQEMEFDSIQIAVQTGAVDVGAAGFSVTPEREEAFDLTHAYMSNENGQKLLVMKGEEENYKTAEDFDGKKVAAQNSSFQETLARDQLAGAEIVPVTNINDAILLLTSGQVDAVAVDGGNGESILTSHPELAFAAFEMTVEDENIVLMLKKDSGTLLEELNRIIDGIVAQGLFSDWYTEASELQKSLGVE